MISSLSKRFNMLLLLNNEQRSSARNLLILMFFGMLLEMLGVGLVVPVIVLLVQSDPFANAPPFLQSIQEMVGHLEHKQMVTLALFMLVTAYALKSIFLSFLSWRRSSFAFNLQAEFAQRLFTLYIAQPYNFHLQRNSAQLIRNASSELTMWTGNVVMPSLQLLAEGMVIIGLCGLLFVFEPVGTLVVLSVLAVLVGVFHRLVRNRISNWGRQRQYHEGMRIQHLQQSLGSIKEVKLLGREADFIQQFKTDVYASANAGQKQSALLQIPGLWLEFFGVLGLVILVLSMLELNRTPATILPTLGLFAAAAFRLMPSANRMLGSMQLLRFGLPVAEMLQKELNLEPPLHLNKNSNQRLKFSDSLKLTGVSFTYEEAKTQAIQNVSLCIKRGESIGLVGTSGSGKSTLIDLLLGLIKPEAGKILIDGQEISHVTRNWQNIVGYVPQMIYLTDDSFRRNIALGIPENEIDDDAVLAALQAAQLNEWVSGLPKGLDTMVGERGVRLSGGQRQRVGIARALYHDPDVLVLDEATSALDNDTEREVMRAVSALKGTKTLIMVAHRITTLTQCDRIYRLENGHLSNADKTNTLSPDERTDKELK